MQENYGKGKYRIKSTVFMSFDSYTLTFYL